jgi:predicted ABC-type ATPase
MRRPIFTLIAGINGAGKSTYYDWISTTEKENLGIKINPDELALEYGNIFAGGKAALKMRAKCLEENISFYQETTFTGKSILKSVDEAKARGYGINLIYVCVDSAEIAIERVANRVKAGGHDIPKNDIIRRYPESLKNLYEQICKFDSARLIDNTQEYTRLLEYVNNDIVFIKEKLPLWAKPAASNLIEYLARDRKKTDGEGDAPINPFAMPDVADIVNGDDGDLRHSKPTS